MISRAKTWIGQRSGGLWENPLFKLFVVLVLIEYFYSALSDFGSGLVSGLASTM